MVAEIRRLASATLRNAAMEATKSETSKGDHFVVAHEGVWGSTLFLE